jgi:hypothetical protein
MALAEDQVHLVGSDRDLLMGAGTRFDLQSAFNPFITSVRAPQGGDRPYAHGSWVGAEWMDARVVPIRAIVNGATKDTPTTRAAIQDMAAAFNAVGATGEIAELHFRLLGDSEEYVLFGRPRGVEPDMSTIAIGYVYANTAFVAGDPRIYSAGLTTAETGLPVQRGGMRIGAQLVSSVWRRGLRFPFRIPGTTHGGEVDLENLGTTATGMTVRIDGPVQEPRLILQQPDRTVQYISFELTLGEGQWLEVDTVRSRALLNGLLEANQRGSADWQMDPYPLLPGLNKLRFLAADYDPDARATAEFRSAWW